MRIVLPLLVTLLLAGSLVSQEFVKIRDPRKPRPAEKAPEKGPTPAATPVADGWRAVADPHGFRVQLPEGWGIRLVQGQTVVFTPTVDTLTGPMASLTHFRLSEDKDASQVAGSLAKALQAMAPDLELHGPHRLDGSVGRCVSLRGGFTFKKERIRFFTLVSVDGRTATVTELAAPERDFDRLKPTFVRILASFRVDGSLRDAGRIAPPPVQWTEWRDPAEGAFTVRVPREWRIQGGTYRPYIDAWKRFDAENTGNRAQFLTYVCDLPRIYTEPSEQLTLLGFREGANYMNTTVRRYVGARIYLEQDLLPALRKRLQNLEVDRITPRHDLVQGEMDGPYMKIQKEMAQVDFHAVKEGTPIQCRTYVALTRAIMPGMTSMWHVGFGGFGAPPARFEQTEEIYRTVMNSIRVNPAWAARERQEMQKRSRIIADTHRDVDAILMDSYRSRSHVQDEIHRKVANAIRGTVDLVNPETGETLWQQEAGYNHYWQLASHHFGQRGVFGTDAPDTPLNATQLRNLDDLR